jgi:hypothetical protein
MAAIESEHAETIVQLSYSLQAQKCKLLIINKLLMVEAAGVEPASENVTRQDSYMLSPVHALGITPGRSRRALRTDKKRSPLACKLSLSSQT